MGHVDCLRIAFLLGLGASFCAYIVLIRSSDLAILDSLQQQYQDAADLPLFGALRKKQG